VRWYPILTSVFAIQYSVFILFRWVIDVHRNSFRFSVLRVGSAVLTVWAAAVCGIAAAAGQAQPEAGKVVVPFDFVSKFDQGRYGQMVGDMIWKKIEKAGQFVIPDMQDIRELCTANNLKIGPDTPLAEVEEAVRKSFEAQIGIWGSVERAPGTDGEIYDLVIRCVDFSTPGEPKVIYEKRGVRTNSVSEIPHLYVKQMLDTLYERAAPAPRGVSPEAEERWKTGRNLIVGGDFEEALRGVPKGWERVAGQPRQPLGNLVKLVPEGGNRGNHLIRFTIPKDVAENQGLMYYSDFFPVEEGATYRFQCRWRSTGPSPKVFIKLYDEMPSEYRPEKGPSGESGGPEGSQHSSAFQRREVSRSQQNLKGPNNVWNIQTEDFHPKHTKYSPKWGKVMLYGYLTEGVVDWDDVVVKQILPPPAGFVKGEKRHSQESKVTLREMQENERRGAEAREETRRARKERSKKKPAEPAEDSDDKPEKPDKAEE